MDRVEQTSNYRGCWKYLHRFRIFLCQHPEKWYYIFDIEVRFQATNLVKSRISTQFLKWDPQTFDIFHKTPRQPNLCCVNVGEIQSCAFEYWIMEIRDEFLIGVQINWNWSTSSYLYTYCETCNKFLLVTERICIGHSKYGFVMLITNVVEHIVVAAVACSRIHYKENHEHGKSCHF
jgi:hypothetical protein